MTSMTHEIRAATVDDLNYIRATWMRSAACSRWARMAGENFFPEHAKVRDRLMARSELLVLGLAGTDAVCAWACWEELPAEVVLHHVFVKGKSKAGEHTGWRSKGLARQLLAPILGKSVTVSFLTDCVDQSRLPEGWTYNPYRCFQ